MNQHAQSSQLMWRKLGAGCLLALLTTACGGPLSPVERVGHQAPVDAVAEDDASLKGGPPSSTISDRPASRAAAARFLTQATFGPRDADIDRLMTIGYGAWIDEQFALTPSSHRQVYEATNTRHRTAFGYDMGQDATHSAFWTIALTGQDQLRQRVAFAMSQIFVISMVDPMVGASGAATSAWLDMLATQGLGNYRSLVDNVSRHPLMGVYLAHLKNRKADLSTGRIPDENFARELLQLFSIGLLKLSPDGSLVLNRGIPQPTYAPADVTGLAHVFTGFSYQCPNVTDDCFFWGNGQPNWFDPMKAYPQHHSEQAKAFLGVLIPAASTSNADADWSLVMTTLAAHPNVGPFLGRQLIQRLVTSNPSSNYVRDVAAAFNNNGKGVRGELKAVVKAILTHPEARTMSDTSGKVREPLLRVSAYLRALGATSDSGLYLLGNTDDTAWRLGQSVLRAPSVFNFYRPGFKAPGSFSAASGLVAPELQIAHETTAAGYVNFMRELVELGFGWNPIDAKDRDVKPVTTTLELLAATPSALVDALNDKLMYGTMPLALKTEIVNAVGSIVVPAATGSNSAEVKAAKLLRVQAASLLAVIAPEFQVQR
jgi:uncharacterized protein (DUF1800 family)